MHPAASVAMGTARPQERFSPCEIPDPVSPRDTRTGSVLEQMILPALRQGCYSFTKQVNIGSRLGGGRHLVDAIAEKDNRRWLVSLKWQQTGGTAEQKVPFEVISLAEAVLSGG